MGYHKRLQEYLQDQADPFTQAEIQMSINLNKYIMSKITASNNSTGNHEPVPAGNHVARCYQMIHIGTIEESYLGELKHQNKVRLVFELPNECRVFNPEKGEQPFSIGKDYTLSMHEKANLRKDLESWRGKRFTDKEAEAFDISVLIGKPCMLNVVHRTSKSSGKTYSDIASITPLPKGFECPAQVNDTMIFGYDPFSPEIFDSLPEWLKAKIASSDEYRIMIAGDQHTATPSVDDDLPF